MMSVTVIRGRFHIKVVALVAALGFAAVAYAQTPNQRQLEIYRGLSPDQQRAIMDSLGRGGTSSSSAVAPDKKLDFPTTIQPKQVEDEAARLERERRLKGRDTILIYLELRKFEGGDDLRALQLQQAGQQGQVALQPLISPSAQAPAAEQGQTSSAPRSDERVPIQRSSERATQLAELRDRIQRRNPIVLDVNGVLNLPESGPIPLAGLTVEEAQQRLSVNEQLRDFKITVLRLPVLPQGSAALKPFGYELFSGSPSTFAPATDIPVPADYVVGPGDTVQVQLSGNTRGTHILAVDREGKVNFPELGPISVGGMQFSAMRAMFERRVRDQMIGTQASVTMGELRSIRIFVLGEVEQAGSFTVSGLSTMTNALFVSGGVRPIGSLRNIELKRGGALVTKLDLYDLLLKGDTRSDARLLPGDVIFIPPIGSTVGVAGEVRRPAIYELNGESTAKDLIELAGGLNAQADPVLATMERIDEQRRRVTIGLDVSKTSGMSTILRNSDVLRIPAIRSSLEQSVTLSGYVHRSGDYEFRQGMRLSDLLGSIDELKPKADPHYILIRREIDPDRSVSILSADLSRALSRRGSAEDVALAPRDHVFVFDLESGRDSIIDPLMRELRLQSTLDAPTNEVRVGGRVKVPGRYPLEPGMRVSDLIRAGGSMDESAYQGGAELTRYKVVDSQSRQTELIDIDLAKIRAGDLSGDILLQPFDYLVIKEIPYWNQLEAVEIRGEVRFPGKYPIHRGEALRSVIARAGGLTDSAFPGGTVFTRAELKERERKQIAILASRMQGDIAQLSLQTAQENGKDVRQALAVGQSMLDALKSTEPVGRLVIDLQKSLNTAAGSANDLILKDGDLLVIPRKPQEVTVLGEVQSVTSHFYSPHVNRNEYINMSGGLTQHADKKRIYVVKADGSVMADTGRAWFSRSNEEMDAGDTIVVPLDAERMRPLPVWQAVTTIIYNLAIAAAAVNSF